MARGNDGLRLGMLVPSSNTCLEPVTYRLLGGVPEVTVHFARVDVDQPSFGSRLGGEGMTTAAQQLAHAEVDAVVWNASSGSWLGVERDREICANLSRICGVPSTSTTLALLEACRIYGVTNLGLATPYTTDVNVRIAAVYAEHGVEIVSESHMGIEGNKAFARIPEDAVAAGVRAAASHAQAVTILCTNLHGASVAPILEAELGIPVFDSVAATLWQALQLVAPTSLTGFGTLLQDGAFRSRLQALCDSLLRDTAADRTTLHLDIPERNLRGVLPVGESVGPGVRPIRSDETNAPPGVNVAEWLEWSRRNLVHGIQSQILEPVELDGALIGWLSAQSVSERAWTKSSQGAMVAARQIAEETVSSLTKPVRA